MLFLVISSPQPDRPSAAAPRRRRFWRWIAPRRKSGQCRFIHARVGRGAAALFDVGSHEELHALLTEWADIIPAQFDLYPLIDAAAAQRHLARRRPA